ncbi:MAG: S9 family peptidase [Planctomycetota bacterium]
MSIRNVALLLALYVLGLAWMSSSSRGQSGKSGLTTADVLSLQQVSATAISPDGKWIAYTLVVPRRADQANGSAYTELHVVSFDGKTRRGFITGAVSVGTLGWTATSKDILFSMRKSGDKKTKVHAIAIGGGESRPFFEPSASVRNWAVAADARFVAYTRLEAADAKRSKESKLGFDRIVFEEEERTVQLYLYDREKKTERLLKTPGAAWELGFSPSGLHLAAWISPTARVDDRYMEKKLYVANLNDSEFKLLAGNPGKVGNFAWCPDGSKIAFIAAHDINDPKESQIDIVPSAGGKVVRLSKVTFEGHPAELKWLDRKTLGFITSMGCRRSLATLSVDEGWNSLKHVIPLGRGNWQHWSLSLQTGRIALIGDSPAYPRELFAGRAGSDTTQRLTVSNPVLAERRLAKQEVVRYPARDGLMIEGVLVHPLDKPQGPAPMIMVIHGGPEAHHSNGWLSAYSMPGQVAAAKGYAVFYPNYRSSTGRGVAFSKLGQGRSALEEFDDIVDGIDHLAKDGLIDPKKVGITGGSYGGYAAAWAATFYSDRFAASVMFVGISDQISKVFTTDIPKESYLVHWRKRPWGGNWKQFLESSPLYYIDRAKTPILIAHGKDDPRVSPTQSMELFRALKLKGDVPVRLLLYPGEGHGNRKRGARLDYALRQMRWFNHYLMGPGGSKPPAAISYELP